MPDPDKFFEAGHFLSGSNLFIMSRGFRKEKSAAFLSGLYLSGSDTLPVKGGGFMIKKVDHIAVAVRSLEETKKRLETLFGAKFIVEKINP